MGRPLLETAVQDIGAHIANPEWYWFLSVTGTSVVTGIPVDIYGHRCRKANGGSLAPSFTYTVPAAAAGSQDGINLLTVANITTTDYPDFAGVIINIAANLYVDIQDGGTDDNDFKAKPSQYPILNSGNGIKLGRVV